MAFIRYNAPVTLTFALACTAVYLVNYLTKGLITPLVSLDGSFSFLSLKDYLNLFTYIFGHQNIEHLLGNMSFILLLGPMLEEKYGKRHMILMMIITAVVTGILNFLFFSSGLWGASGIVFMFIILVSFTNMSGIGIPLTFILIMLLFVGREVMNSLEADSVSQFAHIAGGVIGSLFGFMGKPSKKNKAPEHSHGL